MLKNHLGNGRYFLMESTYGSVFREPGQVGKFLDEPNEENMIRALKRFMNANGENMSTGKLEDMFGLAYITMDDCSALILDTNNYIFVDEENYMSLLVEGFDNSVYAYCINHGDNSGSFLQIQ